MRTRLISGVTTSRAEGAEVMPERLPNTQLVTMARPLEQSRLRGDFIHKLVITFNISKLQSKRVTLSHIAIAGVIQAQASEGPDRTLASVLKLVLAKPLRVSTAYYVRSLLGPAYNVSRPANPKGLSCQG